MKDTDEYENINSENTDSLNPLITSGDQPDDEGTIISNMTYSDYLSAVYSYEEKAGKKAGYDRKIIPLKRTEQP